MLKFGHKQFRVILADLFSDILCNTLSPLDEWKCARMTVLFKKGDAELPQNYRPLSIIPVMAKVFSKILYLRMKSLIEEGLPEEQFGFRPGRGCSDAVCILRMVAQKSEVWGQGLWLAALDVEKAFDRINHAKLFEALMLEGAHFNLVTTLRNLYTNMTAYVRLGPDACSRQFIIQRGVRQGDPLSPALFLVAMKHVLSNISISWRMKGYGTDVSHVAFADDVTLIASCWASLREMLIDVKCGLAAFGLCLHPTKYKAQGNAFTSPSPGLQHVDGKFSVTVVPANEGFVILGTKFCLADMMASELQHRISAAWGKFHGLKRILLHKDASLLERLRAFDATVGSCFL